MSMRLLHASEPASSIIILKTSNDLFSLCIVGCCMQLECLTHLHLVPMDASACCMSTCAVLAGNYDWWQAAKARSLSQVVNMLVNRMEQAGWDTWLHSEGPNHPILVQVVGYSLCNVPLPRSHELLPSTWPGGAVTLEHLEQDGVVQLVSMGEL